ncbi:Thermopsin [Sulfuracidifex tepidarius]|uniref:Thermopsin n=1 Tax=Sulfuracidifex tepidarius TaxID=1294262 RepID=A0A510DSZ8_9CREN|nr:thermopsin [Sulfuracidifex tepidarius]BBG23292.1 Thermopsin [Sulfuracidifex tepidarius]
MTKGLSSLRLIGSVVLMTFFLVSLSSVSLVQGQGHEVISTHAQFHHPHIFPPHRGHGKRKDQTVNVYSSYSSEPAPMGLADYGIGPNGPYSRYASEVIGVVNASNVQVYASGNDCFSIQLNAVLTYNYQGQTYALWAQDVASINSNNLEFIDNVWNMSSPNAGVSVTGNGQVSSTGGISFYYYCDTNTPGSPTQFSYPLNLEMMMTLSSDSQGPEVCFWYNEGQGWVKYDTVQVSAPSAVPYFTIDGYNYTGSGNFYDLELDLVGPGGGSCAYVESAQVAFQLYYVNSTGTHEIGNAYNFGSDTGETSNNVVDQGYQNGYLYAELTAGQGYLGCIWN